MLSKLPAELDKVSPEELDAEICRAGIIAEYDAVNFYEQMASKATDPGLKKVLLDIAKEEKEHVGEFQAMLEKKDSEQAGALKHGAEEVDELTK